MSRLQTTEGISQFTLEYLNQLLLQYPDESRQTASDIVGGFQDAIDDIEDINMDDMDEAYNMLYQNLMTMPTFQGIQSRLAAITLAKFFLEKFQYLPTPSIPLIQTSELNSSLSALANSRPASIDSNDVSRVRTGTSPASPNVAQLRRHQLPAQMNQTEVLGTPTRLQPHASQNVNDIRPETARNISSNNVAATAINNHAAVQSSLNQSVPTNLSEAEVLYRHRQNAFQMAVANAAVSPVLQFSANNPGLQMVHGAHSSNRMPTMPQQLTVYGPNGQPGIQTNLTSVMAASTGIAPEPLTYRHIVPRTQISTPNNPSNSARHTLPPQLQQNRQQFR